MKREAPRMIVLVTKKRGTHLQVCHAAAVAASTCLEREVREAAAQGRGLGSAWSDWASFEGPLAGAHGKLVKQCSRAQQELALQEVPGATSYETGEVVAVALPPAYPEDMHPAAVKAQLSGLNRDRSQTLCSDAVAVLGDALAAAVSPEVAVLLNDDLGMSTGKCAAQAAHALSWFHQAHPGTLELPVAVTMAPSARLEELSRDDRVTAVHDAGHTEIEAGSLTAVAFAVGVDGLDPETGTGATR